MIAYLKLSCTVDSASDLLMISVNHGNQSTKQSLSSYVGSGSASHDLVGHPVTSLCTSACVSATNCVSGAPVKPG